MYNLYQINHIKFKNIYQEDGQSVLPHTPVITMEFFSSSLAGYCCRLLRKTPNS